MIQDPLTKRHDMKMSEGFMPVIDDNFLDGPVTSRIAVLDFDPDTGKLIKGAKFTPPKPGRKTACYANEEGKRIHEMTGNEIYSPEFMQVSVFATILKVLDTFEGTRSKMANSLGRPLSWAFDSPQILVVPRAGEQANAYYHRDSNSLQFFFFPSPRDEKDLVYTCLSRDIVAHETGHVIIDGIAPHLLDACTAESLAIHEALADLTSLLMAFDSRNLTLSVLRATRGSIDDTTEFSSIAEEFGRELMRNGRYLRNLNNEKTLDPKSKEYVGGVEPHAVSEVLSGALYDVMIKLHERLKDKYAEEFKEKPEPEYSASGKALAVGAMILRRMAFRALDYLPPGEVSFADYGRALVAVDTISSPDHTETRDWIISEFTRRHIVEDEEALRVPIRYAYEPLKSIDVSSLHSSDWAAYRFAVDHHDLFHIPGNTSFQAQPRLLLEKKYDEGRGHELLFKVSWTHVEPNDIGSGYPEHRRIKVGTTLAIDMKTRRVLALLTNAPPTESTEETYGEAELLYLKEEYERQRKNRDKFLGKLAADGVLLKEEHATAPDGHTLLSAVPFSVVDGCMRTRSTGNTLHLIGEEVMVDG
jgi:hypothetical protein